MNTYYSKCLWLMLLVGIFASCQSDYTKNDTILHAEQLLNTLPDSAYQLLTSIPEPQKLSEVDYAAWCLNYTNARYKLQKEIKSDSLIMVSINYLKNKNLPHQSGRAYYLLGYIMELLGENEKAMTAYKVAEQTLASTTENKLKGLTQFNMGYMCMQDEMYQQSLQYFKQSLFYFKQCNELKYQAYAYREMSSMNHQLNAPIDTVMKYSNLALKIALQAADSINYYSILSRQGELLYNKDYQRSKSLLLIGYRYFPSQKSYYSSFLAYVYAKLMQTDSANYYLQQSLKDNVNAPTKIIAYHAAALIAKHRNKNDKAYYYLEKSYMLRDSLYQENIQSQLYLIDKQYNTAQREIENATLKIENKNKIIWIILLIMAVLFMMVILLLISNKSKKKHANFEKERQRLEFEVETKHILNNQKRELLLVKLQNKLDNTMQFNKLKKGIVKSEKQETFMQDLTRQSILAENDWHFYIEEVNKLYENKINKLKIDFKELTLIDLMVIALMSLKVNIPDACNLLEMTTNTMYVRRKTIKKRLGLDVDVDLEGWVINYVTER